MKISTGLLRPALHHLFDGFAARVVARYRGNERAAELANERAQVPRAQAGVDLRVEQVAPLT